MKRNLTASDRIGAVIAAMLVMDLSEWERAEGIKSLSYALALSLRNDPNGIHRKQIEDNLAGLIAIEYRMNAYILNHFYEVQMHLGVSPISELAQRAHDSVGRCDDTKWDAFVDVRRAAIAALKEASQVAA